MRLRNLLASTLSVWACVLCGSSSADGQEGVKDGAAKIKVLISQVGGRVDWGKNNLIAFDKVTKDGWAGVWTMKPDGSEQRCLTKDLPKLAKGHNGNPAWHPSGEFIVFQSLDPDIKAPLAGTGLYSLLTSPGAGLHNNLWVIRDDGSDPYPVTSVIRDQGILHPHFSHDGSMLIWAEMTTTKPAFSSGTWVIKKAAVSVKDERIQLSKVETLTPGDMQWYETHGFTPQDDWILFSGMPKGGTGKDFDIYKYRLATKELQALTDPKLEEWDEHAHVSPKGDKIVWMSSMENNLKPSDMDLFRVKTDFWIMNLDGSGKKRLTRFNIPGAPEYVKPRAIASDFSWSPDGTKIVGYVQDPGQKDKPGSIVVIPVE